MRKKYSHESVTAQKRPRPIRAPPRKAAAPALACPAAKGLWLVRVILRSRSRSKTIFSTVQPLIVMNRLPKSPEKFHQPIGDRNWHRYPAAPVSVNMNVWRLLINGQ